MANGRYCRIRPYHYIISDVNFFNVQNGQVKVSGEIVADENVFTVIEAEVFGYPDVLAYRAQYLAQHFMLFVQV